MDVALCCAHNPLMSRARARGGEARRRYRFDALPIPCFRWQPLKHKKDIALASSSFRYFSKHCALVNDIRLSEKVAHFATQIAPTNSSTCPLSKLPLPAAVMAVDAAAEDEVATAAGRAEEAVAVGAEEAAGDVAATAEEEEEDTTPMPAMRDRRLPAVGPEVRRRPSRRPLPVCPRALPALDFRRLSRSDPAGSRCRPSTLLCPRTPCRTSPC